MKEVEAFILRKETELESEGLMKDKTEDYKDGFRDGAGWLLRYASRIVKTGSDIELWEC